MSELMILLVDDNEALNFLHSKLCGLNVPKAEVISVRNGQEAIDFLEENADRLSNKEVLMLLDIRMPVMNGWEVLEEMKSKNITDLCQVVMLTSSTTETDKEKSRSYQNVIGYLEKPLRGFQLIELADDLKVV